MSSIFRRHGYSDCAHPTGSQVSSGSSGDTFYDCCEGGDQTIKPSRQDSITLSSGKDTCADSDQESFDSMDVFVGSKTVPEPERLSRLLSIQKPYVDGGDKCLQNLVELLKETFDVPIALVSLVYEDIQWFKACTGLEVCQTPRSTSFCAYTFDPLHPEVLYVPDAQTDVRFCKNPLVVGPPFIRFYCGAPLITHDNVRLGALCVIDRKPRSILPEEMKILVNLAEVTVRELVKTEMGNKAWQDQQNTSTQVSSRRSWKESKIRQAWFEQVADQCVLVLDASSPSWQVLWGNAGTHALLGRQVAGESLWKLLEPALGMGPQDCQSLASKRLDAGEKSISLVVRVLPGLDKGRQELTCSVCWAADPPSDSANPIALPRGVDAGSAEAINVSSRRQLLTLYLSP